MTNEIMANENTNFGLQTIVNLIGSNALTTNQLSKQMGVVITNIDELRSDMNGVKNDIEELKYNTEVTSEQAKKINSLARKRVFEILGEDGCEIAKYYRTFIMRCYHDCRNEAGLGHCISATKKGDYQRVLNYIDAWIPKSGIAHLKNEIDERAKYRREAKNLGY